MTAKRIAVERVSPASYRGRWIRARRRLNSMKVAQARHDLESAPLLAVHGALAAADAFTMWHLGRRCAYGHEQDATGLVAQATSISGVKEAVVHLRRVLMAKGWAEDSDRKPRPDSTRSVCDHATKFAEFVERTLPRN